MYGDDTYGAASYGAFAFVTLIIPEVGLETKELVIVVEIDALRTSVSLQEGLFWTQTPTISDVGTAWATYMAEQFDSAETVAAGTVELAQDGIPSLRAHWDIGDLYGINEICEPLLGFSSDRRSAVTLGFFVYLDPSIDYTAVAASGGSGTITILTFPGLVGGQVWPGTNGHAYPAGGEPQEGDNWSARIRSNANGQIGPYLYVQNKPAEVQPFGWHRLSSHPLRINDLRGSWSYWEQDCIMNTPGIPDGRCILRINGETIVDVFDLEYRGPGFNAVVSNGFRLNAQVQGAANVAAIEFDYWMRGFSITGID